MLCTAWYIVGSEDRRNLAETVHWHKVHVHERGRSATYSNGCNLSLLWSRIKTAIFVNAYNTCKCHCNHTRAWLLIIAHLRIKVLQRSERVQQKSDGDTLSIVGNDAQQINIQACECVSMMWDPIQEHDLMFNNHTFLSKILG